MILLRRCSLRPICSQSPIQCLWMDRANCAEGERMAAELLEAQTGIQNYALNYIGPMFLKCAVELRIPTIIHNHGRPISISLLSAAIGIPTTKSPNLRRLMRLLAHSGFFSASGADNNGDEIVYSLTPLSRLLVIDNNVTASLSPLLLTLVDPVLVTSFHSLATWFRGDATTPFQEAHGCEFWENAHRSPVFNEKFNAGMASDSHFVLDALVKQCGPVLRGVRSLVDVGGGTGTVAKAISEAFPEVKCSVLDLAQVVEAMPKDGSVEFIVGDMFEHVPPADAVLLKWILHDWDDEECMKILRRCKEAIPTRDEGGKVIIIDLVVGSDNSHPKFMETQLYWDMLMMTMSLGTEREEHEWKKIFTDAGFTDYKIVASLGLRSVIELYP